MQSNLCVTVTLSLATTAFAATAVAGEVRTYRGMCNASAAVSLKDGRFVVADDESNSLRLYSPEKPDPGPKAVELDDLLKTEVSKKTKTPKEADIEGAARLGGRIYWITSHGTDSGGDEETSRRRLFATTAGDNGTIRPVKGAVYSGLVEDLIAAKGVADFDLKAASTRPPKGKAAKDGKPAIESGLNIEGLAADPGAKTLLIGFRSPIAQDKAALILPLTNPADVVGKGAHARFGAPSKVALGGRGIRSLERIGDHYLIVAGLVDDQDDFALYSWAGPGAAAVPLSNAKLKGLKVEALYATPAGVRVLSDDGKLTSQDCQERPDKTFRGMTLEPSDLKP